MELDGRLWEANMLTKKAADDDPWSRTSCKARRRQRSATARQVVVVNKLLHLVFAVQRAFHVYRPAAMCVSK